MSKQPIKACLEAILRVIAENKAQADKEFREATGENPPPINCVEDIEDFALAAGWSPEAAFQGEYTLDQVYRAYKAKFPQPRTPDSPHTINQRMMLIFSSGDERCVEWSLADWAEKFGCSREAIRKTDAWKAILKDRERERKRRAK